MEVEEGQCTAWEKTCISLSITYVFTEIISENISLSYRNIFQPPEQFKMPNPQKPRSVNRLHGAKTYQRILSRQGEMIQKNKRYHCFQNSSISHRRTSQMIRRSPTAYEGGYTFYRKHCEMTSFQTRGGSLNIVGIFVKTCRSLLCISFFIWGVYY